MTFFEKCVSGFFILLFVFCIYGMIRDWYSLQYSIERDRITLERSKEETKRMQATLEAAQCHSILRGVEIYENVMKVKPHD